MAPVVRPFQAGLDDFQALSQMVWESWLSGHGHIYTAQEIAEIRSVPNSLQMSWPLPDTRFTFVAQSGSDYVGALQLRPYLSDGTYALVEPMNVSATHQRQGVGSRLWSAAEDFARQRGDRGMKVWAMDRNPKAMSFYPKMKCHVIGVGWVRFGSHVETATGYQLDF